MERGNLKIRYNDANQLIVEAKIANGILWMTKHEIADLFNVYENSIRNSLRTIFKSGILKEESVTQTLKYELNGRTCEAVLYNIEAIIHIGFRITSFEAEAFRIWVVSGGLTECPEVKESQLPGFPNIVYSDLKVPFMTSWN